MIKVFVDGSSGTTGIRINERLAARDDIEMIVLTEETRKDDSARSDAMHAADVVFWCLPDDAAKESVSLAEGSSAVIIDTSTAHRTDPAWTYGFAELTGQRALLEKAKLIANPGCHASGFIALAAPLTECGILPKDQVLTAFSLTGYSGGGKKMIAEYEDPGRDPLLKAPRQYALTQAHKHLPEMAKFTGLEKLPVFCPVVGDFYSGMQVNILLDAGMLKGSLKDVKEAYAEYYKNSALVKYAEAQDIGGYLSALNMGFKDDMLVSAYGNDERIVLTASFDNLGKGASGAAIQNMNIALGLDETLGLVIG